MIADANSITFIHDTTADVIKFIKLPAEDCNDLFLFRRLNGMFVAKVASSISMHEIREFEAVNQRTISLPQSPEHLWSCGICPDSFDMYLCAPNTNSRLLVNLQDARIIEYGTNVHSFGRAILKTIFPTKLVVFLITTEGHLLCEILGSASMGGSEVGREMRQELNDSFATLKNHMDQFYQKCTFDPVIFSRSCCA